jgi:hypothetical protein
MIVDSASVLTTLGVSNDPTKLQPVGVPTPRASSIRPISGSSNTVARKAALVVAPRFQAGTARNL